MADHSKSAGSSPLSLIIPGRPEYVALCRLVAGAVGVRDSLDEEVTADLKVLVTEACNCLLAREGSGGVADRPDGATARPIRMDIESRPDTVVVRVFSPAQHDLIAWLEGCPPTSEPGLGLTIMRSLSDEMVEVDTEADGMVLTLTKRLPV